MKILINGVTLENANLSPLLYKIKTWQSKGAEIHLLGNAVLDKRIKKINILNKKYSFIEIKNTKKIRSNFDLIFEGFKRNFFVLKRLSNFDDFDVVYCISSVLDLAIFPFFLKLRYKKIKWVSVFDNKVEWRQPGNKITRILSWIFFQISLGLLKKSDYVFTVSKKLVNFLIINGFNKKKIVLTGNAVEIDLIKKAKKQKKYQSDALFVGRINKAKGIYDLLEVLKRIKKKLPFFQFSIMGQGDLNTERQYKKDIKKFNLQKNIKFLGFKTGLEKYKIIKSSKLFLFLSHNESFGVALLEAVCCGLPAIAYNLPVYNKIYKNSEANFFQKADYDLIAKKVFKLVSGKMQANKNGRLLLNNYSLPKIADKEYCFFQK